MSSPSLHLSLSTDEEDSVVRDLEEALRESEGLVPANPTAAQTTATSPDNKQVLPADVTPAADVAPAEVPDPSSSRLTPQDQPGLGVRPLTPDTTNPVPPKPAAKIDDCPIYLPVDRWPLCWRCGYPGHARQACNRPQKIFCSRCGLYGTMSRDCPCDKPPRRERPGSGPPAETRRHSRSLSRRRQQTDRTRTCISRGVQCYFPDLWKKPENRSRSTQCDLLASTSTDAAPHLPAAGNP